MCPRTPPPCPPDLSRRVPRAPRAAVRCLRVPCGPFKRGGVSALAGPPGPARPGPLKAPVRGALGTRAGVAGPWAGAAGCTR